MEGVGAETDQSDGANHFKNGETASILNEAEFDDPVDNIYRAVFPCNKSSSKQLMIALEPDKEFTPSITLSKPGKYGVKITESTFLKILQVNERLTNFFNGDSYLADLTLDPYNDGQKHDTIQVGKRHHLVLYLTKNSEKVAALVYNAYNTHGEVTFTNVTWHTIMRLSVLVKHLLAKYKSYKDAALKMYRGLCFTVHHEVEISYEDAFNERVLMVQEFLMKRVCSIPKPSPSAEPTFDAVRAFEEIKLTCVVQITEEVAKANDY
jgi:hypothetical protein